METGISMEQLREARESLRRQIRNPVRFRFLVVLGIVVPAWFGLLSPLESRLATARADIRKATNIRKDAADLRRLREEKRLWQARLKGCQQQSGWQTWILDLVKASGTSLLGVSTPEPPKRSKPPQVKFTVQAQGRYGALVDLVDRIERSRRLVRVSILKISPLKEQGDHCRMVMTLTGLVSTDA